MSRPNLSKAAVAPAWLRVGWATVARISEMPTRWLDRLYSIVYAWGMNIRDTIRHEVKRQGLTHAELARRVGTYRPHVVAYLSGRADMTGETLDKLCNVLGLELQRRKGR